MTARPGLGIGEMDAPALDPVPFERDDFADAASGEHQQADDGDDMRAVELVAGAYSSCVYVSRSGGFGFRRRQAAFGRYDGFPESPSTISVRPSSVYGRSAVLA